AFDEPPGPEYQDPYFAYLPPNTPYVIDIREVTGTNYQFAFSYFIPAGYNPNWEGGFIPPEFNSEAHGFYAPYKYPGFYPADVIRQTANTDLVISWDNIDNKIDLKPDSYQLSDGVSDVIGNFFGEDVADLWVLPYDYDAVCLANPNATCELEERVRT